MVLSALPTLFLGMIAGTVVDRSNRKTIMIWADIVRGLITFGFLLVTDIEHVWLFGLVLVAINTVSTFFGPARTALLPLMLSKDELLAANALSQLTVTLSFVVGAAAAGVLVGAFDATAPSFFIDALTFFVSAYFISRISISGKIERKTSATPKHVDTTVAPSLAHTIAHKLRTIPIMFEELLVGLRYIFTDQIMRGVLISFLAMFFGLGAANVTFVPLLIDELGMPEEGLGLIRFSQTLGIMLGSAIVATSLATRYKPATLIGGSMVVFGITTIMVSVVANFPLMVFVLFLVGLAISPPQIVAATLMQRHVPSEKLGRASGAQNTIITVANITSMGAAGYLMDKIGSRAVFTWAGVLIFSAGFVSWWVLRGVDHAPDEEETALDGTIEERMLDDQDAAPNRDPVLALADGEPAPVELTPQS
jgi:MFS transporter, DHA3 family, macrolide efflux protein